MELNSRRLCGMSATKSKKVAQGLTSSEFSYMEELRRPVHAGIRMRWNEDHGEVK